MHIHHPIGPNSNRVDYIYRILSDVNNRQLKVRIMHNAYNAQTNEIDSNYRILLEYFTGEKP